MKSEQSKNINPYAIRHWPVQFFFLLMRLLAHLPYRAIFYLGTAFGWFMYKMVKQRTRIARINIERCFPHWSRERQEDCVKKNLISTGIGMLETAMLWFGPNRNWEALTEIVGMEYLEKAKKDGKGALLLSFHLTSLEIGGSLLGTQTQLGALYRKNENPLIEEVMVRGRKKFVHPIPREATREMVRWIKDNGVVWYAADQDYGRRQSLFVPFYNIPTATITATTRFVKLTGAPVIPMTQERIGKGDKIRVTIHPPLTNIGVDPESDARQINAFLENYLNQHPEEYLWVHRRFKTRPSENDPSFYPKKTKARAVTPQRYKNMIESAEWIEMESDKPSKLKNKTGIVYFIYRKGNISDYFSPPFKHFLKDIQPESHSGKMYRFKGLVRFCESENCDLVYLEEDSND